ncbi:unnamed protein product [Trichogramma brassicae]|uniref:Uncharacterized protein n=1 Tax=Trichogramma brassicae TaxID=86971 RepID=A0A6H5IJ80_9HYME|nr:unnamed protein product [Trichogramma brassicae]
MSENVLTLKNSYEEELQEKKSFSIEKLAESMRKIKTTLRLRSTLSTILRNVQAPELAQQNDKTNSYPNHYSCRNHQNFRNNRNLEKR